MATTLYLVVSGRGTTEQVERYFYGRTRWESPSEDLDEYGYTASILAVTADSGIDAEREAMTQADRLRSGLYGVLTTGTLAEASEQQRNAYEDAVGRLTNSWRPQN